MTIGLFVGRFQPFHLGHLHDIVLISKQVDEIKIVIGSSQESGTEKNPFTYEERVDMIKKTLKNYYINYEIFGFEDVPSDTIWVSNVIAVIQPDIVYTGNKRIKKLFEDKRFKVRHLPRIDNLSGTHIRAYMKAGSEWKHLVPRQVSELIE